MRTIKLTIAATETHCEVNGHDREICQLYDQEWAHCNAFAKRPVWDGEKSASFRLPECIAAEKEAGK